MPAEPPPAATRRLPLLDGLRGIAAIAVMGYHAGGLFGGLHALSRAYLFVDLFFLLSGFVLGLAADPKLRSGQLAASAFIRARLVRLWPVLALGVLLGAIPFAQVNSAPATALALAFALLLLPLPGASGMPWPVNGPHWSLAMEVLVNLAHALLLKRLGTRALLALAGVMGLALAAQIMLLGMNNFATDSFSWPLALLRVGFAYPLGLALARLHAGPVAPSGLAPVALIMLAVLALPYLPLAHGAGDAVATLLVLPGLFWWATRAALPRGLETGFAALGALSYPLYAVHLPLLVLARQWRGDGVGLALGCGMALAMAGLLALALERRRVAKRLPAQPAPPGSDAAPFTPA